MPAYQISQTILGSFNQANAEMFGQTAGTQCSANCLYAIFWSRLRRVSIWKTADLDKILIEGDKLYKQLDTNNYLAVDEMPHFIESNGFVTEINFLNSENFQAKLVDEYPLLRTPLSQAPFPEFDALMIIDNFTIAIMNRPQGYFIFDSHCRNELGLLDPDGKSCLLKFDNIFELEKYIQHFYLEERRKDNLFFLIQFIQINELKSELKTVLQRNFSTFMKKRKRLSDDESNVQKRQKMNYYENNKETLKGKMRAHYSKNKEKINENQKEYYSKNKETINQNQKDYYSQNKETINQNQKDYYSQNKETINQNQKDYYSQNKDTINMKNKAYREINKETINVNRKEAYQKSKTTREKSDNLVTKFKKLVFEGPFYICVCCNRCLYRQSVVRYLSDKYNMPEEYFYSEVVSFDGQLYICKTCHNKLKKDDLPCQSVKNKLDIDELPAEFHNLRRLEKVLIARRILFKKIAIMPKGQFPKLKGSIVNVPIDIEDFANTLPRRTNDNGLVIVKLKRKLEYKGHVIFEPIRPDFIQRVLFFLKENNPLYGDIVIDVNDILEDHSMIERENDSDSGSTNSLEDKSNEKTCEKESELQDEVQNNFSVDELETASNPLDAHRSSANETTLMSHTPSETELDNEILTLAPGQGKKPISILNDENCEMLAHPHLFPKGKFGYKYERDVKLSPSKYFNQRLLNYTQKFASDPDYIFFANTVIQQVSLTNQINVAMRKVATTNLNAGMLSQNFKETVKRFIANDKAFAFMSTVKGTPAYWKKFQQEVLAMVKQLGPPTFFQTLSCADLRWPELISIIYKLKGQDVTEEFINNLSYHERCDLLNSNPVLVARHFQYRVEVFFKTIVLDGPLGKTTFYAIRVEFQVRGSPHIHSFLWILNAPILTRETKQEYIEFVDRIVKVYLPPQEEDPELFNLVKTYQLHRHSKTCRKYKNTPCRFQFGKFFSEKTIVSEPLPEDLPQEQKQTILALRKELLTKVKTYINQNLNPSKRNFFDQNEENFIPAPTIDEVLLELNIPKEDYEYALSVSDDNDFHIYLKRDTNACFVNNYFTEGLKAWEANLDIQPVFNYYKAVSYMCAYLSKTEDEVSHAMNQAVQESFENGADKYEQMKSVAHAYVSKREVSVQESCYLSMPELWLRKVYPGVTFANTNVPEKRFRMCLSENEISELPEDSTSIFKKNMLDRYCDRPSDLNGINRSVAKMCYAEFLRFYSVVYDEKNENDCQPNPLEDELIEANHSTVHGYPKVVRLKTMKGKLKCRKVPLVLRLHEPNRNKHPEDYAHHLLMLYLPFRDEKELLSEEHHTYTAKLLEPGVIEKIEENQALIQPYSGLVNDALERFRTDITLNMNDFEQQENDETNAELENDFADEQSEDENTDDTSQLRATIPMESILLPDDEINARIRSLNQQQREVFDVIHKWGRDFVKNLSSKVTRNIEPFHIFLTGGGGVGKSHLLTTIYHSLSKLLMYRGGEPAKERILVLAPTAVAAINVNGTTIHTGLIIPTQKLFPLNSSSKQNLQRKLSCVEVIMIDEISMVPSRLFRSIDARLREIFGVDRPFGGKSVLVCGDLYQLPPIFKDPIYKVDCSTIQTIIGFELWRSFQMAELTEVMRQRDDIDFVDLLNQVRVGKLDKEKEELLKSRFISKDNPDYPADVTHIFAENKKVDAYNSEMLDRLPNQKHLIYSDDDKPDKLENADYLKFLENAKVGDTGGLARLIELKEGARVLISKNIDITDRLVNGQVGTVMKFKFNNRNIITGIYVKLDDSKAGKKGTNLDHLCRENNWVLIERAEATFDAKVGGKKIRRKKRNEHPMMVRRTQFPLVLSYACTSHKVQGLTLKSAVVSFELDKQRCFNEGQMYVNLSRVTDINGLYLVGEYKRNAIRVNSEAEIEYERLRENYRLHKNQTFPSSTPKNLNISLLNICSLSKHCIDIKNSKDLMNSDLLCLTETQLSPSSETNKIDQTLDNFRIDYNNDSVNRHQNTAVCSNSSIQILECQKAAGYTLIKFLKQTFSNEPINLLLLYKPPHYSRNAFCQDLSELLFDNIEIIVGDFNIDAQETTNADLNGILSSYEMIVNEPTHLAGGLLDHVYLKRNFISEKEVTSFVKDIYFSDHDGICFTILNNG